MQELNVKTVIWWSSDVHQTTLTVNFDFTLTEELKAEGQARELVRSIQDLRKKHGVNFAASTTVKVPDWPAVWQQFIEEKTHSKLIKGETLELEQST